MRIAGRENNVIQVRNCSRPGRLRTAHNGLCSESIAGDPPKEMHERIWLAFPKIHPSELTQKQWQLRDFTTLCKNKRNHRTATAYKLSDESPHLDFLPRAQTTAPHKNSRRSNPTDLFLQ